MITTARLREYLQARPFRPFRVYLSDGSYHDIPHPEFAWLLGSRLYVAWIDETRGPEDPASRELAVLHITRIEPLALPGGGKSRKAKK